MAFAGFAKRTDGLPIIVMIALSDVRLGIIAVKEGAIDYFVKDELPSGLLERTIRCVLENRKV